MKDVPKPLLILIVVIVILGFVSCGAGVIRGLNEDPQPAPSDRPLGDVINAPVNRRDVDVRGIDNGSCSRSGAIVSIAGACLLTVEPQVIRPRVLRLEVINNPVDVTVRQVIDGKAEPSNPETKTFFTFNDDEFEISVAGSSPVFARLECGACDLRVID